MRESGTSDECRVQTSQYGTWLALSFSRFLRRSLEPLSGPEFSQNAAAPGGTGKSSLLSVLGQIHPDF
jgi:hypothetical protein